MTKKNYEAVARCVRENLLGNDVSKDRLVAQLSRVFAEDNPRFDPARFRAACYTCSCGEDHPPCGRL